MPFVALMFDLKSCIQLFLKEMSGSLSLSLSSTSNVIFFYITVGKSFPRLNLGLHFRRQKTTCNIQMTVVFFFFGCSKIIEVLLTVPNMYISLTTDSFDTHMWKVFQDSLKFKIFAFVVYVQTSGKRKIPSIFTLPYISLS